MHDPKVPETLEGWCVLHHMFRLQWNELKSLSGGARREMAAEAASAIATRSNEDGSSALVHMLGHKADLMLIHFRRDFEQLSHVELAVSQTRLSEFLEWTTSYVSIVELGLYEMTAKIHQKLNARGLKPGADEFNRLFDEELDDQKKRMYGRLFSEIPKRRYVCFYPMNKKREQGQNWYIEPYEDRGEMMLEHGIVGRHYSGKVTQIISGSIGLDDWEWGVDLFADEPLVFKKLIYEMRFDRASAVYADFGPFYVGLQFSADQLAELLEGRTPALG